MPETKEMSLLNLYVMTYEQAQQLRLETMNRMRCWLRDTIPEEERPSKDFSDKQVMESDELPLDIRQMVTDNLEQMEKDTKKMMKIALEEHPLWDWMKEIKGIGPVLAARLLHRISGKEFPQVSNLWSYAGLDGPNWRDKPHNWELTSVCHLIGKSFQYQRKEGDSKYRQIYDERKEYEKTKPPCSKCFKKGNEERCSDGHVNNKARRYAAKEFLKDLWVEKQKVSR